MSALKVPEGSVIITPAQMYEEMRGARDEVKHLSSIIDPALNEVRTDVAENKAEIVAVKTGLRTVENRQWFFSGVAAAAGAIGGYLLEALVGS